MHQLIRRDERAEPLDVSGQKFLQMAAAQYVAHDLIVVLQLFKHFRTGGIRTALALFRGGQFQLFKQHNAELRGRIQVEPLSRLRKYLFRYFRDLAAVALFKLRRHLHVYLYARRFHVVQYVGKRQFCIAVERLEVFLLQFGIQLFEQRPNARGGRGNIRPLLSRT